MPEYYRLSKKDLTALDSWWEAYKRCLEKDGPGFTPTSEDICLREFLDKQKELLLNGSGKR